MYSLLQEIDKYIKENNIPFKTISINNSLLPDFINLSIIKEIKKRSSRYDATVDPNYEFRYDKDNDLYLLVYDNRHREIMVINNGKKKINEDFNFSGRSEKHIIKWGCLFKLLENDLKTVKTTINNEYGYLKKREKARLEYEIIDQLLEDKFNEFVKSNKLIEDTVYYEDELIESTFLIKDYIRYLYNYYKETNNTKKR